MADYVTPPTAVPDAGAEQQPNYVVAHSMFSSPVTAESLSSFITSEQAAAEAEAPVDVQSDAR